jgi:hypothetical protein
MPPRRISDTTRSDVQRPAETARGVDAVNTPAGTRRSRRHYYGPTTFNSRRRPYWSSTHRSAGWGTGRRKPRTGRRPRRAPPRRRGRADHRTTARRLRRDADARRTFPVPQACRTRSGSVQDVSRRVVDIEEDGVEAAARCLRIKTDVAVGHGVDYQVDGAIVALKPLQPNAIPQAKFHVVLHPNVDRRRKATR